MKPEELSAEQETKLNSDELEAASGGTDKTNLKSIDWSCPRCGSKHISCHSFPEYTVCSCNDCGCEWTVY